MNSNGVNFSIHKDGMGVKQLHKGVGEGDKYLLNEARILRLRFLFWLPCNFLDIFPYIWM